MGFSTMFITKIKCPSMNTTTTTSSSLKMRISTILNDHNTHKIATKHEDRRDKARRLREEDEHFNAMHYEEITDQRVWIEEHREMERRVVAVRQRLARFGYGGADMGRLEREIEEEEEEEEEETSQGNQEGDATDDRNLSLIEKKALLSALSLNKTFVTEHWKTQPFGNTARAYELDINNLKPSTGRSVQWEYEIRVCAERGGCCAPGKKCGCCWKPQGVERKVVKGEVLSVPVFAHCTGECGCCVKWRGRYDHDESLMALQAGQRW